jgi:hypothetical protein
MTIDEFVARANETKSRFREIEDKMANLRQSFRAIPKDQVDREHVEPLVRQAAELASQAKDITDEVGAWADIPERAREAHEVLETAALYTTVSISQWMALMDAAASGPPALRMTATTVSFMVESATMEQVGRFRSALEALTQETDGVQEAAPSSE